MYSVGLKVEDVMDGNNGREIFNNKLSCIYL